MSTDDTPAEPMRRPTPSRVGPQRRASGMFRRPDDTVGSAPPGASAAGPRSAAASPKAGEPEAEAAAPEGSAARRAVDAAYRICEDYLARGRDAARDASTELPRMDPVNARPDELLSQALRIWQDTARMWVGYMTPFLPGNPTPSSLFGGDGGWDAGGADPGDGGGASGATAGGPGTTAGASGAATAGTPTAQAGTAGGVRAASFVAEVAWTGPARLEVELFRTLEPGVTVPALWPSDPNAAPLRAIEVRWEGTTPVFAVAVPPRTAAGRYEGPIRDGAGRGVGMVVLTLRVKAGK